MTRNERLFVGAVNTVCGGAVLFSFFAIPVWLAWNQHAIAAWFARFWR